ncbi:hypothetical protein [Flavobacterium sp.]|uniref:hypothetical protein n=1 Tax=Flavobacterium sp. TaxID=239 RepID=UPI0039E677A1
MNKLIILFFFLTTLFSCQSQSRNEGKKVFEKELSNEIIDEIEINSPFNDFESLSEHYYHKNYFEIFGNSGFMILYHLDEKITTIINAKMRNYEKLNNDLLLFEESSRIYRYQNSDIKLPEISESFEELKSNTSVKDKEVEIIHIKKGTLKNVFKNNEIRTNNETKFSTGIFILKDQKKIIFWVLLYS